MMPTVSFGTALLTVAGLLADVSTASAEMSVSMSGDARHGKQLYAQCVGCHSPERHRTGPKHCGLIGRQAGAAAGFDYSKSMRESKLIWSVRTLDSFLFSPLGYIPGTNMGIAGIKDDHDRSDLIAYLIAMNQWSECR
ncbi:c-type cytochrome [Motiliproteus sp.]|uniref:c-type cytochrome n=1 Tax=Motiliproteus sp. TaxID=1898955 RepID=UPI003BAB50E3